MRPARPKRWTKQEDGELAALLRPLLHTTRLPREELRTFAQAHGRTETSVFKRASRLRNWLRQTPPPPWLAG